MANFVYKIITCILTDRLGPNASRIVSPQQHAFFQGRSISDATILTSECMNILDKKCVRGNVAIKLDIRKAFDTLDWDFLLQVLITFRFSHVFIN